ncbi:Fpg/Nei family DNA glycosylase [Solirubrobacter soli]|uniref:Fpg/Nei family DNA glycosylase n=1 Tax=Solirubrobacter soli TaxID=363832 RepID=UPI0004015CFB|nr:DNA-formamidopyrimidine glycosylase family protein [Solirubrobacter soli]
MPEGDTIHYAANRIRPVLEGRVPDRIETPHPRFRRDRWPERLAGQTVTSVDAHGKHLFLRFENGLVIHSHLRMTGKWRVRDAATYEPPRNTWLILRAADKVVAQINGPVLELMTQSRTRFDQRIAGLGPDILAPALDEAGILRRLRTDDPTRAIGDALLDQRIVAGIGNMWKAEGCFHAGIDPWRRTGDVSDEEVLAIIHETRPRMQESALGGMQERFKVVHGHAGEPCPRCGAKVQARGQGDDNRTTYWCAGCQR